MDPTPDTSPRKHRIRPSGAWYGVAALLILAGALVAIRIGFHEAGRAGATYERLRRVVAPALVGFVAGMLLIVRTAVARGRARRRLLLDRMSSAGTSDATQRD